MPLLDHPGAVVSPIAAMAPSVTALLDAEGRGHPDARVDLLSDLTTCFRIRRVHVARAIGRDLKEADRILVWHHKTLDRVPHLRELLEHLRHKVIVGIGREDIAELASKADLASLRRRCASRFVCEPGQQQSWQARIGLPVLCLEHPGDLKQLLQAPPGAQDEPAQHVEEARRWIAAGELDTAFRCVARALRLAPDLPHVVVGAAEILAALGAREKAAELCRTFLLQRPDAEVVRQTLAGLAT